MGVVRRSLCGVCCLLDCCVLSLVVRCSLIRSWYMRCSLFVSCCLLLYLVVTCCLSIVACRFGVCCRLLLLFVGCCPSFVVWCLLLIGLLRVVVGRSLQLDSFMVYAVFVVC